MKRKNIFFTVVFCLALPFLVSGGDILEGKATIKKADDYFTKLVENTKDRATFTLDNKEATDLTAESLDIYFDEICGSVTSYKIYIEDSCQKIISKTPIYSEREVCPELNATSKEGEIAEKPVCYTESYIIDYDLVYGNVSCLKEVSSIPKGEANYTIVPNFRLGDCGDGWGYKIDWIPKLTVDSKEYEQVKWAWWNASYAYKYPINCSNLNSDIPFVVDGYDGFAIGGKTQLVQTICSGADMAVYYNSYNDYVLANGTQIIPYEVFRGNVTSYQSSNVWNTTTIVASYHLEYNASSSTGSNHGAVTGATLTTGHVGKAYSFDGNDYISVSNDGAFSFDKQDNFTLNVWFKISSTTRSQIIGMDREAVSGVMGYEIKLEVTGKIIGLIQRTGGDSNSITSAAAYSDNNWHMATLTYNNTIFKLYIDGVSQGTETFSQEVTGGSPQVLMIGARRYSSTKDRYFNGVIDEVIIWNRTLSADEINQTYQNYLATDGFGDIGSMESLSPVSDPCVYSGSGTWTMWNCNMTSNTNAQGNDIVINGSVNILANITNYGSISISGTSTRLRCTSGGCFKS